MSDTTTAPQHLSFFMRVKAELKHLFVHAPGWEASAAATLTYVAPMVEAIVAVADPAAAPLLTTVIQHMQSAMAAAAVVIKDAGPTPTLVTYLKAILGDVAQLESAAQIQDPAILAKVRTLASTISEEVAAILKEAGATA